MSISNIVKSCNPFELPSVLFNDRSNLPRSAGVYFVIHNNASVLYIGKSNSIYSRWRSSTHDCKWQIDRLEGVVKIAWLERPYSCTSDYFALELIEKALIGRFQPPLNTLLKTSDSMPVEELDRIFDYWRDNRTVNSPLPIAKKSTKLLPVVPVVPLEVKRVNLKNKKMVDKSDVSIDSMDSAKLVDSVLDGLTTTELQERYKLKSRSTLSNRMEALSIMAYKGPDRRFYVSMDSVELLDTLDKCLQRNGATLSECAAQVKIGQPTEIPVTDENSSREMTQALTPALVLEAIATPLNRMAESLNALTVAMAPTPDPFTNYRYLTEVAQEGWALPTSELLPLLGLKSTPPLDEHRRFKRKGFSFQQLERAGREREWRVTRLQF